MANLWFLIFAHRIVCGDRIYTKHSMASAKRTSFFIDIVLPDIGEIAFDQSVGRPISMSTKKLSGCIASATMKTTANL